MSNQNEKTANSSSSSDVLGALLLGATVAERTVQQNTKKKRHCCVKQHRQTTKAETVGVGGNHFWLARLCCKAVKDSTAVKFRYEYK